VRGGFWGKFSDLVVVVGVVGMVVMMIVPLAPGVLDILLAANMALTLLILLVALHTTDPLHFSVFPSLLLVVTLFRLALNISGTRLILLHAHAGQVISAFGAVVVGGNYVVGAVVFVILVIIQFVVLTSGAQRVAEVAARFTLDAMPGKQMSIDADLNAGNITDAEARKRREAVEDEADFYGAMDGASKFVRGDAIAAVVIILVNVVGGLVIGVLQNGMSLVEALQTYTLLTVGEGLVTQIPALLVSTATGIVVTRAASNSNLGQDLSSQLMAKPRALALVACLMIGILVVPGLPRAPFLLIGAGLASGAWALWRQSGATDAEDASSPGGDARPTDVGESLDLDALELTVGSGLLALVDRARGGTLVDRLTGVRRDFASQLGVMVPAIRIRDVVDEAPNRYVLRLFGAGVGRGEARPSRMLAIGPVPEALEAEPGVEPTHGLPAGWIRPEQEAEAQAAGCTTVDATSLICTHVYHMLRMHAAELLGRQDVRRLLDRQRASRPALVDDLVPSTLGLGEVQRVLRNLLRERISIRNIVGILEAMADGARLTKEPDMLTEHVRQALARTIAQQFQSEDGLLRVVTLAPQVEQVLMTALRREDRDVYAVIGMTALNSLYTNLVEEMARMRRAGHEPIVLTYPSTRPYFKRVSEQVAPGLVVVSYAEVPPDVKAEAVGVLRMAETNSEAPSLEAVPA
jgi:flagellar biosynthesis protein FlhA